MLQDLSNLAPEPAYNNEKYAQRKKKRFFSAHFMLDVFRKKFKPSSIYDTKIRSNDPNFAELSGKTTSSIRKYKSDVYKYNRKDNHNINIEEYIYEDLYVNNRTRKETRTLTYDKDSLKMYDINIILNVICEEIFNHILDTGAFKLPLHLGKIILGIDMVKEVPTLKLDPNSSNSNQFSDCYTIQARSQSQLRITRHYLENHYNRVKLPIRLKLLKQKIF